MTRPGCALVLLFIVSQIRRRCSVSATPFYLMGFAWPPA
jgi:hypothetical protein